MKSEPSRLSVRYDGSCEAFLTNMYVLLSLLAAGIGAAGYIVLRWRNPPEADQVSPSVLDRIRTEYR
jgi:hypothetical protein